MASRIAVMDRGRIAQIGRALGDLRAAEIALCRRFCRRGESVRGRAGRRLQCAWRSRIAGDRDADPAARVGRCCPTGTQACRWRCARRSCCLSSAAPRGIRARRDSRHRSTIRAGSRSIHLSDQLSGHAASRRRCRARRRAAFDRGWRRLGRAGHPADAVVLSDEMPRIPARVGNHIRDWTRAFAGIANFVAERSNVRVSDGPRDDRPRQMAAAGC